MRCKAHVRVKHVDDPSGIKNAGNGPEDESTLLHSVFVVHGKPELEEQSHHSLRANANVEEEHVEKSGVELAALVNHRQSKETGQTGRCEAAQLQQFVLIHLFKAFNWCQSRCDLVLIRLSRNMTRYYINVVRRLVAWIVVILLILVLGIIVLIISVESINPASAGRLWLLRRTLLNATLSEGLKLFLDARLVHVLVVRLLRLKPKLSPLGQAGARVGVVFEGRCHLSCWSYVRIIPDRTGRNTLICVIDRGPLVLGLS